MNRVKFRGILIFSTATFFIMVALNALANILPINGKNTGEISDSYTNLFAPAGITFSIWGVIYLLLLVFTIFYVSQFFTKDETKMKYLSLIGLVFGVSSVANSLWILAWHYEFIGISLILMLVILVSLIVINLRIRKSDNTILHSLCIRWPFTIYFAWITVATIANITTFLVRIQWERFGLSEVFWTDLILLVGAVIGGVCVLYFKSMSYGLVIIWAYVGILIKHTSTDGFGSAYLTVIIAAILGIAIIIMSEVFILRLRLIKKPTK